MNYYGSGCPHCGIAFDPKDDIVVCPECGTPHHRACYKDLGRCANEALHGTGWEWTPPVKEDAEKKPAEKCLFCAEELIEGAVFCNSCGKPVLRGDIDGIPLEDWVMYLGKEAPGYLTVFKGQDISRKKTAIYIPLLFFPPMFFLRRRMWLEWIAYELLSLILALPAFAFLMSTGGAVLGIPEAAFTVIIRICGFLLVVARMLCAMYGVWLYRKSAVRRIRRLRKSSESPEMYREKLLRSRPTWVPVIILGIVYIAAFLTMPM